VRREKTGTSQPLQDDVAPLLRCLPQSSRGHEPADYQSRFMCGHRQSFGSASGGAQSPKRESGRAYLPASYEYESLATTCSYARRSTLSLERRRSGPLGTSSGSLSAARSRSMSHPNSRSSSSSVGGRRRSPNIDCAEQNERAGRRGAGNDVLKDVYRGHGRGETPHHSTQNPHMPLVLAWIASPSSRSSPKTSGISR